MTAALQLHLCRVAQRGESNPSIAPGHAWRDFQSNIRRGFCHLPRRMAPHMSPATGKRSSSTIVSRLYSPKKALNTRPFRNIVWGLLMGIVIIGLVWLVF